MAPILTLADLETVFDTLEGSAQKLHYLLRRTSFEMEVQYSGDEMDLLAYYLDTGFNLLSVPEVDTPVTLHLTGHSEKLDQYYIRKDTEYARDKPRLKLTRWWRDITMKAEAKQIPHWTRITNALLDVPREQQRGFEQHFNRVNSVSTNY